MSRFWRRFGKSIIIAVPGAAVFMDCIGYAAKVEGSSMQPLLNPDSSDYCDIVFLNRTVTFDFHKIKRGDVIALTSPRDPSQKLIKRVVGLQGDSIRTLKGNRYVHIPPGHIWVEGDNHKHSYDSNHFGPISMGLTVAKATYILWPPKRISPIESEVASDRTPVNRYLCQQCFEDEAETPVEKEVANIFVYSSSNASI